MSNAHNPAPSPRGWSFVIRHSSFAILLFLAFGCANYTTPIVPTGPQTVAERNFETTWNAVMDTLRKNYFKIDRADRRDGVITTLPMTGSQWFEWWRHDSTTNFALAESSLQTIYRKATVTVKPLPADREQFAATVQVETYRSERSTQSLRSLAQVYDMFSITGILRTRMEYLLEHEEADDPNAVLVDLGRDAGLERLLQQQLDAELQKPPAPQQPTSQIAK